MVPAGCGGRYSPGGEKHPQKHPHHRATAAEQHLQERFHHTLRQEFGLRRGEEGRVLAAAAALEAKGAAAAAVPKPDPSVRQLKKADSFEGHEEAVRTLVQAVQETRKKGGSKK